LNPFKKLLGQTAIYGLSSVVGRLLNYLLVPLYTRYFLPEEYAIVVELYAYVAFLVIILTYGIETAFFRFTNTTADIKSVYSTALFSVITTSCIFIALIFVYSSSLSNLLGSEILTEYIQWFAIIVSFDAISSIPFARLRKRERALQFSLTKLINISTNIGLNLYFIVYKGFGIEYIFISNLVASIITLLLLTTEIFKATFSFDFSLWKRMMIYAFPLLIAGLAGITNETIDRVLLKHLIIDQDVAVYELGLYGAFYKLSIIMVLFTQTFRFAAEPYFFSLHKNSNNRVIYADVMKYFIIVMSTIFLVAIVYYDIIIKFLGSNYHDERGFVVVSILLLANLFLGVYFNLSIWYKLTEKTIYGAFFSLFGALITLTLNFLLIPKIGFVGSAWATLACYFSMMIVSYYYCKKHFPIPYQISRILVYLIFMLTIYFFVYFTNYNVIFNSLLLLLFIIFVCILERKNFLIKT
jgi:O-antigen/teichoic acid export membrane protein